MKTDEKLSGALQENILVLLCFDAKNAKTVRYAVTAQLFESAVFREVAGIAIDFIDQFGEPVGEHLPDHLEHILKGEDTRKAASYDRLVQELFLAKDTVNGEYVIGQLHKFVRQQNMKSAVLKAVEALGDGRIDDAEVALTAGLNKGVQSFERGTDLSDPDQAMRFLNNDEAPLMTGIEALDRFEVGPAPKTLFLLTGPLGKGKSWGLMQIGKYAMIQRKVVVHITLEMSEEKTTQRYLQMMFAITKKRGGATVPRLTKAFDGGIKSVEFDELELPSMQDDNIRELLRKRIKQRLGRRASFTVKKFPSGTLTIAALNAYLDGLERHENVVPDVLIIDYAELMHLDDNDFRRSIGKLYVDLRGIADARNCAVVTASQVNRPGANKATTDEKDLSEDFSKGFTVDTMVTYNQTDMEHKMGLARLHVAKNRDGEGKMTVLITQAYAMGQFCLDSVVMPDRYMGSLMGRAPAGDEDDERGDREERAPRTQPRPRARAKR